MRRRVRRWKANLATWCVLLSAVSILARAAEPGADVISGKWGSDSQTLLDLTFDGNRTITGTAYFYIGGDEGPYTSSIEHGTFDPETGALKLEGDFTGPEDAVVQYVIEGQLEQDVLRVRFDIGGNEGSLTMKQISP